MSAASKQAQVKAAQRTALTTVGVALLMGGVSFAAVPFYDWFCRVTGFSGTPQVAASESAAVLDQTVVVRFDANTDASLPWRFEPVQREMTVRIGENALASYRATNTSDQSITGTATFNVTPYEVGYYFSKIDCFCFTEQTLAPGESVEMPVSFYVDPAMVDDPENNGTKLITLSYTFFEQDRQAALPNETAAPRNDAAAPKKTADAPKNAVN